MLTSYAQLTRTLITGVTGVCLLDSQLGFLGASGTVDEHFIARGVGAGGWPPSGPRMPLHLSCAGGGGVVAISLDRSDGSLLGAFCLQLTAPSGGSPSQFALDIAARLQPVLDCLHRELVAGRPSRARMQLLTERTAELQWLFSGTEKLTGAAGDRQIVNELLGAATARLHCAFGVLLVPERRIELEHVHDKVQGASLRLAVGGLHKHLMAWAQRHHEPLVINGNATASPISANFKLLSVPVGREGGRVAGVLVFCNPSGALDFCNRHIFLACHLGRQMATLVDAQFDLMTGLYTRGGLEQIYRQDHDDPSSTDGSVVYVDIDRMQVVNELHGFELGDEVIVRIAELASSLGVAEGLLAARMSGDRFALVLPRSNTAVARQLAANLQAAAAQLVIGPPGEPVEISISCGVAALVHMPQGLARALAAAELACKKAKERGRNRVEVYACDDSSMMRPHDDAIAVGQLRAAIKADRLILYAQRIAPLQNPNLPGGYELLMRLRDPHGDIVLPGPLVAAAQRYQLLPAIDRWVVRRSLELLSPYRNMLTTRGISMSINVSGQSIGDEAFVRLFTEQLKAARLPTGCVTVEITEQAAVTNLARANEMTRRLGALGCRLALDDFGTGANSLVSLKSLPVARVKIDGGFVRDIMTNERSQATVRAIVELAKGYSIDTVAEYVENGAIADTVRRLGVDYAQGYAFGKPQPLEDLLASLGRDEPLDLNKMLLERT